ncbi:MAG TPA: lytic transglycosylase domain-containing protein [Candidatus Limnocylindrales bacterium]
MGFNGKRAVSLSVAAVLTCAAAIGGTLWLRDSRPVITTSGLEPLPSVMPSAEPSPVVESPSPSPTLSPSRSPSKAPTKAPVKPSRAPVTSPVPAPPPPPKEPTGCVPHYEGTNVPRDEVGTALLAAANTQFWPKVAPTVNITLPPNLVKAVAEQESGWQSAIVSCVGAVGAMQVLPATGDWMNQRFSISPRHDVRSVWGNAMLGSAYLQWLVKYFGDAYFQRNYELKMSDCSVKADVPDHREFCLLNAVISAYNVGQGTVDNSIDDGDLVFYVNHSYIENVRALMSRF